MKRFGIGVVLAVTFTAGIALGPQGAALFGGLILLLSLIVYSWGK